MVTLEVRFAGELGDSDWIGLSGFSFFWVGIYFLFIISILLTFLLRLKLGLISGIAGCLLMALNIFFPSLFILPVIQSMSHYDYLNRYNVTEYLFINFIIWILFCVINLILFLGKVIVKDINFNFIKKTILDLGIQYANLEVREISEVCKASKITIIDTIEEMIKKKEIYADYFKSSRTVAFNKQANIKEIDNLMAMYGAWEEGQEGKV